MSGWEQQQQHNYEELPALDLGSLGKSCPALLIAWILFNLQNLQILTHSSDRS